MIDQKKSNHFMFSFSEIFFDFDFDNVLKKIKARTTTSTKKRRKWSISIYLFSLLLSVYLLYFTLSINSFSIYLFILLLSIYVFYFNQFIYYISINQSKYSISEISEISLKILVCTYFRKFMIIGCCFILIEYTHRMFCIIELLNRKF